MDRNPASEVDAALARARRDAEIALDRATRRAIDRQRAAFERSREALVTAEEEMRAGGRELAEGLGSVREGYANLGEALARLARRVTEISREEWPELPAWPPRRAPIMELTYSESRRLSLRLAEAAAGFAQRPAAGGPPRPPAEAAPAPRQTVLHAVETDDGDSRAA